MHFSLLLWKIVIPGFKKRNKKRPKLFPVFVFMFLLHSLISVPNEPSCCTEWTLPVAFLLCVFTHSRHFLVL